MDLIQTGQKISVNIQREEKIVEIISTISKIEDDRLTIELPPYFMRYIEYLEVGRNLTLKAFSKIGTIDFNAVVINSPLEDDDFCVELDTNALKLTPNDKIPIITAIETLVVRKIDSVVTTKTIEISTEHIKFYSDKAFKLDESVDCKLILPDDYGIITFKATVSNIDMVYENEYTISYSCMTENDRQNLLYYMYIYTSNLD